MVATLTVLFVESRIKRNSNTIHIKDNEFYVSTIHRATGLKKHSKKKRSTRSRRLSRLDAVAAEKAKKVVVGEDMLIG